jgi:hypothetical protein
VLAALGAGAGLLASAEAAHPDATVHAWISAARASCGPQRPVSEVPGLGASWLCAPNASPWLVLTPAEGLVVQARQVTVEQGGRWRLADSRWSLRGPPEVDLQATEASLAAGSASWTRRAPRRWLAPGALLGAWLLGGALLATLEGRRWVAVALGSACAGVLLSLQGAADAGHLAPRWLALQPLLAALPGVFWWGHRGPRWSRGVTGGNGGGSLQGRAPAGGSRSHARERRGLTPPSRTGGKRGRRRGASAGPPSRPPCIPPPRPPAGARRVLTGRFVHPRSRPRPLPIPCGDGTRGAGSCREVLCSGGPRYVNGFLAAPGLEARGRCSSSAPKPRTRRGSFEFSRSTPGNEASSPGLASGRLARLAWRRLASPRLTSGSLPEARSPVATTPSKTRILSPPAPRVPSPQGMGKGRAEIPVCTPRPVRMRRARAGGRGGGMQGGRDGGPALAPRRLPLLPPVREGGVSPRRSPPECEGSPRAVTPRESTGPHAPPVRDP